MLTIVQNDLIRLKNINVLYLIPPLLIFSLLMLPHIGSLPYLDGNIDFVKSYDLFNGGLKQLMNNWGSIHPPLKEYFVFMFFKTFGVSKISYNLVGYLLGLLGIAAFFKLSLGLTSRKTALVSSLLLASSGMFISVGIFSLIDYLLAILVIISMLFYLKNKLFLYSIFAGLAFLSKETGVLLPFSVVIVELFSFVYLLLRKKSYQLTNIIYALAPFLVTIFWILFLKTQNKGLWSDWIFAETASRGAAFTIYNNLVKFKLFNVYAYQNWKQLFFLNFNWCFWLLIVCGLIFKVSKIHNLKVNFFFSSQKAKTVAILITFCLFYLISVLSFQTYTIPRYALPIYPFLYLASSVLFMEMFHSKKLLFKVALTVLPIVTYLQLFYSIDPVSKKLWGEIQVLDETLYGLNSHLSGNDGMTYNIQYLKILKGRTILLEQKPKQPVNCQWIIPDPNNENKTFKILQIEINKNILCGKY